VFEQIRSKLFGKNLSNATAKNRLQMVLVQDRSGLSSQDMENFRADLLGVISKYFVLERKSLEIEWQRSDSSTALIINTPVAVKSRGALKVAAAS
jgi:cell division topological specificity factor